MKQETLKFTPNIPLMMNFKFDQPKTGTGQYGEWYLYGVEHQGQDAGIFASKGLHDRLQQLGQIRGRSLEITRVVDEAGKTRWVIVENGADITPEPQQTPTTTPNTPPATPQTPNNANSSDYVLSAIKKLNENIQDIEKRLSGLETLAVDLKGKPAVEPHQSTTGRTPEEEERQREMQAEDVKIEDLPI